MLKTQADTKGLKVQYTKTMGLNFESSLSVFQYDMFKDAYLFQEDIFFKSYLAINMQYSTQK